MAEKNLFDDLDPVEGPAEIVSEETQVAAPSANLFDDIDPPVSPEQSSETESEQGVIESIARGVGAGFVDIAQGVVETAGAGMVKSGLATPDFVDQNAVTESFEGLKNQLGFTPERTAGKIAETITNYATPGLGVYAWVSKARKVADTVRKGQPVISTAKTWFGKSAEKFGRSKVGQIATKRAAGRAGLTTLGTGLADVLVSPSTNTTLADSWDAMPDGLRTESEQGLIGKELASVRLRNKFRLGFEGAMFNLAGEIALPAIGGVVRGVVGSEMTGLPLVARTMSKGLQALGNKVGSVPFIKRNLTPNGSTPSEIATAIRTTEGMNEAAEASALRTLSAYDSSIKKAISFQRLTGRGKQATQRAYNDTMDYLTGEMSGDAFQSVYKSKAKNAVDAMRAQIDDLSTEFEASVRAAPNLDNAQQDLLLEQFQNNQGTYIRRLYELHLNPDKFKNINPESMPQFQRARDQLAGVMQTRNRQLDSQTASQQATSFINDLFDRNSLSATGLTQEAIERQSADALAKGAEQTVGRTSLFRLAEGMLKERSQYLDNAPILREMMGEVRNPREAFLLTVDNMANTKSAQRLFDSIASSGQQGRPLNFDEATSAMNQGGRPFAINGNNLTEDQVWALERRLNYVKMGEMVEGNPFGGKYGSLSGMYVPTEISNSLTTPGRASSWSQEALAIALQAKGLSQMTKTVLSPISQVRNVISNFFVLGANGLFGRNMGVFESGTVLMANALDSPEQFKLLKALQNEGAIGQNVQLRETERLLKEQTEKGASALLNKAGKMVRKTPVVGKTLSLMENSYRLGDDWPKAIAALGEKARYSAALRKGGVEMDDLELEDVSQELLTGVFGPAQQRNAKRRAVKDALVSSGLASRSSSLAGTDFSNMMAVDLVKSTMPTYSMVPEAIKNIRRVPVVGNFISYPAEVMRTTGNILGRSLKELGFQADAKLIAAMGEQEAKTFARQVRGIGAERLTGLGSSTFVAPIAIREAAHTILDITPEEEEMLNQNKPWYAKGNLMVFLEKPDKDLNAEAIDLSYMLPYEYLLTPIRAAMETYQAKGMVGASEAEAITAMAWEGFKKLAEPFASESLGAERVIDVTTRQGTTKTGSLIYDSKSEGLGDVLSKSMTHIFGAFIPGIVENAVTVKGGEFKQGRVLRAITETPSKSGSDYSAAEEAGAMMTGLRPVKVNLGKSLGFSGSEYAGARSSAVRQFTRIADDNDVTGEQVVSAYIKANEARRRQQAALKLKIDTAINAGFTQAQIYQTFKNTGVSKKEVANIIYNRYVPFDVSRSVIREVSNEVNVKRESRILQSLPLAELNSARISFLNTPIVDEERPSNVEQGDTVEQSSNLFDDLTPSPPIVVPPQAPAPQPTPSFVDTATSTVSGAVDAVSGGAGNLLQRARTLAPGLLGDPKNQDIIDRARQPGQ